MAQELITSSMIAKEALMQLKNNLVFGNLVHREYKKEFVKVGDSVAIRRPVKFLSTDGSTLVKQDVEEGSVNIVISGRKHVGWEFDTKTLTLDIEDFSERYIQPAAITLANSVDSDLAALYKAVWNHVGTPGSTPSTFSDLGAAGKRLDQMAVPRAMRRGVFDPEAAWSLADGLKGVFVQDKARGAFEEARIGRYAALDTYGDQNIKTHVVGVNTGTPLVDGAAQNVTYQASKNTNTQLLVTKGWTNSITDILLEGDVFTIDGVYAVNPVSKDQLNFLQQFVVAADADSGATTGPSILTISPPIITSGPYQTVNAAPADNAPINVVGTGAGAYPQSLAFHRNAFALVTIPLDIPDGVSFAAKQQHSNLAMRVIKAYDITSDAEVIRLDIMYGVKAIYPDLAARVTG